MKLILIRNFYVKIMIYTSAFKHRLSLRPAPFRPGALTLDVVARLRHRYGYNRKSFNTQILLDPPIHPMQLRKYGSTQNALAYHRFPNALTVEFELKVVCTRRHPVDDTTMVTDKRTVITWQVAIISHNTAHKLVDYNEIDFSVICRVTTPRKTTNRSCKRNGTS